MVTVEATPVLQNFWKNTGKNPAMTVVANAELAQSYSAQANTGRFLIEFAHGASMGTGPISGKRRSALRLLGTC